MKKKILNQMFIDSQKGSQAISLENLSFFPSIVQNYLRYAITEGSEAIYYTYLQHGGEFRISPDQRWFPIKGTYHYLTSEPSFYWKGVIKPLPLLSISARDYYFRGKGEVKIKLNSLIPLGKSTGTEIDKASLMRYVSEAPLFPSVFLTANFIFWEELDSSTAKIIIKDSGIQAEGVFTFNAKGEITKYESIRARDTKKGPIQTGWTGYFKEYKEFNGYKIPTLFIAEWNLDEGDFQYVKFKVSTIKYNCFSP
ncbi:MAG: DUF6920 family protein [Candidatus Heimdallarchaeaceae archaeon]